MQNQLERRCAATKPPMEARGGLLSRADAARFYHIQYQPPSTRPHVHAQPAPAPPSASPWVLRQQSLTFDLVPFPCLRYRLLQARVQTSATVLLLLAHAQLREGVLSEDVSVILASP